MCKFIMGLFGYKRVVLRDIWGGVYKTWAIFDTDLFKDAPPPPYEKRPDGAEVVGRCYVYPFKKVGGVVLYKDGSTGGSSSYIDRWREV